MRRNNRAPIPNGNLISLSSKKFPSTQHDILSKKQKIEIEIDGSTILNKIESAISDCDFNNLDILVISSLNTLKKNIALGSSYSRPSQSTGQRQLNPQISLALISVSKSHPQIFSRSQILDSIIDLLLTPHRDIKISLPGPAVLSITSRVRPFFVLLINILFNALSGQSKWPTRLIKVYVEDSVGDRVWVDQPECSLFVKNIEVSLTNAIGEPRGLLTLLNSIPSALLTQNQTTAIEPVQLEILSKLGLLIDPEKVSYQPLSVGKGESCLQDITKLIQSTLVQAENQTNSLLFPNKFPDDVRPRFTSSQNSSNLILETNFKELLRRREASNLNIGSSGCSQSHGNSFVPGHQISREVIKTENTCAIQGLKFLIKTSGILINYPVVRGLISINLESWLCNAKVQIPSVGLLFLLIGNMSNVYESPCDLEALVNIISIRFKLLKPNLQRAYLEAITRFAMTSQDNLEVLVRISIAIIMTLSYNRIMNTKQSTSLQNFPNIMELTIEQIRCNSPATAVTSPEVVAESWLNKWLEIANNLSKGSTSDTSLNYENLSNLLSITGAPYILMVLYTKFRQEFVSALGHYTHSMILTEAIHTAMKYTKQAVNQAGILPKQPLVVANIRCEALNLSARTINIFSRHINQFALAVMLQSSSQKGDAVNDSSIILPMNLMQSFIKELAHNNVQGIGQFPSQELAVALLQDKGNEIRYYGAFQKFVESDSDSNQHKTCLENLIKQIKTIASSNVQLNQALCEKSTLASERAILIFQMYVIHLTQALIYLQMMSATKILNQDPSQRIEKNFLFSSNQARAHTVCSKQIRQSFIRWIRNKLPYLISNFAYNRIREMSKSSIIDSSEVNLCCQAIVNHILPGHLLRQILFIEATTPFSWKMSSKKRDNVVNLPNPDHFSLENCSLIQNHILFSRDSPLANFNHTGLTMTLTLVPVSEKCLIHLLNLGMSQGAEGSIQMITSLDAVDMSCDLIFRAAAYCLYLDNGSDLSHFTKHEQIVNCLFESVVYNPASTQMSSSDQVLFNDINKMAKSLGYSFLYWKVILALITLAAYAPKTFGVYLSENYPIISVLIDAIIIGDYSKLNVGPNNEEVETVLKMESYLLGLTTPDNWLPPSHPNYRGITTQTSTLLGQLILLKPKEVINQPPQYFCESLFEFEKRLQIKNRLCSSREPDFLLSTIKKEKGKNSCSWLSDFVRSNEANAMNLPIQCLIEYIYQENLDLYNCSQVKTMRPSKMSQRNDVLFLSTLNDRIKHVLNQLTNDQPSDATTLQSTLYSLETLFNRLAVPENDVRMATIKTISIIFSSSNATIETLVNERSRNESPSEGVFNHHGREYQDPDLLVTTLAKLIQVMSSVKVGDEEALNIEFFKAPYPERLAIILRKLIAAVKIETDPCNILTELSLISHIVIDENKETFTKHLMYSDFMRSLSEAVVRKIKHLRKCVELYKENECVRKTFDSFFTALSQKISDYLDKSTDDAIEMSFKTDSNSKLVQMVYRKDKKAFLADIKILEARMVLIGLGFACYSMQSNSTLATMTNEWFHIDPSHMDDENSCNNVLSFTLTSFSNERIGDHLLVDPDSNVVRLSKEFRELFLDSNILPLFKFAILDISPLELYLFVFSMNIQSYATAKSLDDATAIKATIIHQLETKDFQNCIHFKALPSLKKIIILKKYKYFKKSVFGFEDSADKEPDLVISKIEKKPLAERQITKDLLFQEWERYSSPQQAQQVNGLNPNPLVKLGGLDFMSSNHQVMFGAILDEISTENSKWHQLNQILEGNLSWRMFVSYMKKNVGGEEAKSVKVPDVSSREGSVKEIDQEITTMELFNKFLTIKEPETLERFRVLLIRRMIKFDLANLQLSSSPDGEDDGQFLETFLRVAFSKEVAMENLQKTLIIDLIQKKYDKLLSDALIKLLSMSNPEKFKSGLVMDFVESVLNSSYMRFPLKLSSQLHNRPDEFSSLLTNESHFDISRFDTIMCQNLVFYLLDLIDGLICQSIKSRCDQKLLKINTKKIYKRCAVLEAFMHQKERTIIQRLIFEINNLSNAKFSFAAQVLLLIAYSRKPNITQVIEKYISNSNEIISWLKYPSDSDDFCQLIRAITFYEFERLNSTLIVTIVNQTSAYSGEEKYEDYRNRFSNITPTKIHQQSSILINSLAISHPRCSLTFLKPISSMIKGRLGQFDEMNVGVEKVKTFNISFMNTLEFILQFMEILATDNKPDYSSLNSDLWRVASSSPLFSKEAQNFRENIESIFVIFFEMIAKYFTTVTKHFIKFIHRAIKLFVRYLASENTKYFTPAKLHQISASIRATENFKIMNHKSNFYAKFCMTKLAMSHLTKFVNELNLFHESAVKSPSLEESLYLENYHPITHSLSLSIETSLKDIFKSEYSTNHDQRLASLIPYLDENDLMTSLETLNLEVQKDPELLTEHIDRLLSLSKTSKGVAGEIFSIYMNTLEKVAGNRLLSNSLTILSAIDYDRLNEYKNSLAILFLYKPREVLAFIQAQLRGMKDILMIDSELLWHLLSKFITVGQFEGIENICIENATEFIKNPAN